MLFAGSKKKLAKPKNSLVCSKRLEKRFQYRWSPSDIWANNNIFGITCDSVEAIEKVQDKINLVDICVAAIKVLCEIFEQYYPNRIILSWTGEQAVLNSNEKRFIKVPEQGTAAYICEGQSCRPPVFSSQEVVAALTKIQL